MHIITRNTVVTTLWTMYFASFAILTLGTLCFVLTWDGSWLYVRHLKVSFYCMLVAMCLLYSILVMTLFTFFLDTTQVPVYMSLMSVLFGVVYPIAAIVVLVVSIYLAAETHVGFSSVFGIVAGGLMLLFYVGLRSYDYYYIYRRKQAALNVGMARGRRKVPKQKHIFEYIYNKTSVIRRGIDKDA